MFMGVDQQYFSHSASCRLPRMTCVKISDTKNPGFMPPTTPPSAPTTRSRSARRTRPSRRPAPCSRLSSGSACGCRGLYGAAHGEPRLLARGRRAAAVHLALEDREEGPCRRVVVAAAGAATREPHVVFPGPRRQSPEVHWLPRPLWKMALRPCGRACGPARGPRRLCRRRHVPGHTPTRPPCGC